MFLSVDIRHAAEDINVHVEREDRWFEEEEEEVICIIEENE